MGLGHGVGADCSYPPGLAWEIEHCLPVIPRPQWQRYLRNGAFTPGIQKILDQTAHCHEYFAVVVDDEVIQLDEPIRGVFPPGWHRGPCLEESRASYPRPEREPGAWGQFDLDRSLPGGSSQMACLVGRTVDLLLPYPLQDMTVRFPDGATHSILAGDMGNLVLRIPGAGHPLNNTGYGVCFTDRRFLSHLGRGIWDHYDVLRRTASDNYFLENTQYFHLFVKRWWGGRLIGEWTAPFQRTHMGCPRNHYPHSRRYRELGIAGEPVRYRWAQGGESPLPPTASDYDVYEEAMVGWGNDFRYLEVLHDFDEDGNRYTDSAPEGRGGPWIYTGGPEGDPPGTYLIGGTRSAQPLTVGAASYSKRLGCGSRGSCDQVGGIFDIFEKAGDFLKSAAGKILERVEKILPDELEELADKIAPIASVALPPPFGTAAKAYQTYRAAVQQGDYDLAAQVTEVLKKEGLPDPLDVIEGKASVAAHPEARAGGTTGELGSQLAKAAGSLGLAAAAVTAGALTLRAIPRQRRFQASFRRRR